MKRILQIYPQLNNAGTEMVITNWYRNINRDEIQFDFLTQTSGELDTELQAMGAKIYCIPNGEHYKKRLVNFFKKHPEYTIIHTHTHKEMGVVLEAAKLAGVPYRIAHSHNSRTDLPKIFKLYKMITEHKTEKYATHFMACSDEAANWLFPTKHGKCTVVKNAIELDRFIFNFNAREKIRKELNIPSDSRVICHVGRFAEQKNHARMIGLLNRLTNMDFSLHAILVGIGPLYDEIKAASQSERIHFLGGRRDVPDIISASDLFLFPSLYEGLGIVAVEAQVGGIKCIASYGVPSAADIGTGLFERLSLKESDEVWLEKINKSFSDFDKEKRKELSLKAYGSDYNIKTVAEKMEQFYKELK